jgi:hypothetical protein
MAMDIFRAIEYFSWELSEEPVNDKPEEMKIEWEISS